MRNKTQITFNSELAPTNMNIKLPVKLIVLCCGIQELSCQTDAVEDITSFATAVGNKLTFHLVDRWLLDAANNQQ